MLTKVDQELAAGDVNELDSVASRLDEVCSITGGCTPFDVPAMSLSGLALLLLLPLFLVIIREFFPHWITRQDHSDS